MRQGERFEFKWAIDQLVALGYLKSSGPEHICLTDSGIEKGKDIALSMPIQDRVLLLFYHGEILEGGEYE